MADKVLYQTDDDLSQDNLAASTKRQNAEDYVERGLSLSNYDSGALTVDVSAGHCIISAGSNAAYDVFPDARSGVSLTGSAVNSVYVVIDPTAQDDVTVESLDSGTPSNPYLKIGEVDTSAGTVSDVSRDPDGAFEKVSTEYLANNQTGRTLPTGESVVAYDDQTYMATPTLPTTGYTKYSDNPILTASDTSNPSDFVADCHAFNLDGDIFIAYEDDWDSTGRISIARLTDDARDIDVLAENLIDDGTHTTFPEPSVYDGQLYLTCQREGSPNKIELFKYPGGVSQFLSDFPNCSSFNLVRTIKQGSGTTGAPDEFVKDGCHFVHDGTHWFLMASGAGGGSYGHLYGVYAEGPDIETDTLTEAKWAGMPWKNNVNGFWPVMWGDQPYLFYWVSNTTLVYASAIKTLTPRRIEVEKTESEVIPLSGSGFDSSLIHAADPFRVSEDEIGLIYDGNDGSGWEIGVAFKEVTL